MKTKIVIAALMIGIFTSTAMYAQNATHNDSHEHMKKTTYTCSMHPEIEKDKPGDCPKCGMKLIKKEMKHDKMAKTYTCSMHPEVKSNKPGDCQKCGMKLREKKMDMKKGDAHNKDEHNHKH